MCLAVTGACPFPSQQRLDHTETARVSLVLVLGMRGSEDPAEVQDRGLTAGFSAPKRFRALARLIFGDCVLTQIYKDKLREKNVKGQIWSLD